jgi:hypothetical protein
MSTSLPLAIVKALETLTYQELKELKKILIEILNLKKEARISDKELRARALLEAIGRR